MISVGHIAKTYGLLPSEVKDRATTFDVMITDVYTTWEEYRANKSSGAVRTEDYKQDDLLQAVERIKNVG